MNGPRRNRPHPRTAGGHPQVRPILQEGPSWGIDDVFGTCPFFTNDRHGRPVANRLRPRCPECKTAMGPVYRKGARGKAMVRIPDAFYCATHDLLAHGRTKVRFL